MAVRVPLPPSLLSPLSRPRHLCFPSCAFSLPLFFQPAPFLTGCTCALVPLSSLLRPLSLSLGRYSNLPVRLAMRPAPGGIGLVPDTTHRHWAEDLGPLLNEPSTCTLPPSSFALVVCTGSCLLFCSSCHPLTLVHTYRPAHCLVLVRDIARLLGVQVPTVDAVLHWAAERHLPDLALTLNRNRLATECGIASRDELLAAIEGRMRGDVVVRKGWKWYDEGWWEGGAVGRGVEEERSEVGLADRIPSSGLRSRRHFVTNCSRL